MAVHSTMLIWIVLMISIVKNQAASINNVVKTDDSVDNTKKIQLQDSPDLEDSKESAEDNIIYQQIAWDQIVAELDKWEVTGVLGSKLRSVTPPEVVNEDASELLDYLLATVIPFANNSRNIADAGTALNMHNCYVDGIVEGLYRDGPAILSVDDDVATLIFTITTNTLKMSCDWYQRVFIKYYGVVSGTLSTITVETIVDMKMQPDQHPVIRNATVKNLGEIESDITGVGPLGTLVKTIINNMVYQYRDFIIDSVEQQAPTAMRKFINVNETFVKELNEDSENDNEIESQQNLNHIEDKKNYNDNIKVTEKQVEDLDEYNGNVNNNEIETQVKNTNNDRTKEEEDLLLLNEYGNNIHPKLKQVVNTNTNKNKYQKEEEKDLNLLDEKENNINPKFKNV